MKSIYNLALGLTLTLTATACSNGIETVSNTSSATNEANSKKRDALPNDKAFEAWAGDYAKADAGGKVKLEKEGKERAAKRKNSLLEEMRKNPEAANEHALPYELKKHMPESIKTFLEEKLTGRGRMDVALTVDENGQPGPTQHHLTLGDKTFVAHVPKDENSQGRKEDFLFNGIKIGDEIALTRRPARILTVTELEDIEAEGKKTVKKVCPVSGRTLDSTADAEGGAVEIGGEVLVLCSGGHIDTFINSVISSDGGTTTGTAIPTIPATWTSGTKKVLYIRANYSDDLSDPQSVADATASLASVNQFLQANSYGKLQIVATITPLLTLPKTKAEYVALDASGSGSYTLLADARAMATTAGYNTANFDLDAVRFNGGPGNFGGMGYIQAKGVWLKTNAVGTARHEIGHNLGAWHSNFWATSDGSSVGAGSNQEYGDSFDTMGTSSSGGHFNPYWKSRFGWIPASSLITITPSTTNRVTETLRISAFDLAAPGATPFALRILASHEYWLDLRRDLASNPFLMNGLELHWAPWASSGNGTHLIDATPGSANGKSDAAIAIGSTFTDPATGISITPLGLNGTVPESMDLRIESGTVTGTPVTRIVQTLSAVSPATATLTAVKSQQFASNALDQFGAAMANVPLTWTASCGSITNSGLFTAPASAMTCKISASSGAVVAAAASATVYQASLSKIYLTPATLSLARGATQQFAASARDQYGLVLSSQPASYTWSASCGTISATGLYTASVKGRCVVNAVSGALTGIANVSVGGRN
ncbi:MAG: hypothetical protein H7318_17555 [Oligoflexus sp.]|nr:hypothetical protein [Oligoflexus sp.]